MVATPWVVKYELNFALFGLCECAIIGFIVCDFYWIYQSRYIYSHSERLIQKLRWLSLVCNFILLLAPLPFINPQRRLFYTISSYGIGLFNALYLVWFAVILPRLIVTFSEIHCHCHLISDNRRQTESHSITTAAATTTTETAAATADTVSQSGIQPQYYSSHDTIGDSILSPNLKSENTNSDINSDLIFCNSNLGTSASQPPLPTPSAPNPASKSTTTTLTSDPIYGSGAAAIPMKQTVTNNSDTVAGNNEKCTHESEKKGSSISKMGRYLISDSVRLRQISRFFSGILVLLYVAVQIIVGIANRSKALYEENQSSLRTHIVISIIVAIFFFFFLVSIGVIIAILLYLRHTALHSLHYVGSAFADESNMERRKRSLHRMARLTLGLFLLFVFFLGWCVSTVILDINHWAFTSIGNFLRNALVSLVVNCTALSYMRPRYRIGSNSRSQLLRVHSHSYNRYAVRYHHFNTSNEQRPPSAVAAADDCVWNDVKETV